MSYYGADGEVAEVRHAAAPRLAQAVIGRLVPAVHRPFILGDLDEEYAWIASERGEREALVAYLGQVFRSMPGFILLTLQSGSRGTVGSRAIEGGNTMTLDTERMAPSEERSAVRWYGLAVFLGLLVTLMSQRLFEFAWPLPGGLPNSFMERHMVPAMFVSVLGSLVAGVLARVGAPRTVWAVVAAAQANVAFASLAVGLGHSIFREVVALVFAFVFVLVVGGVLSAWAVRVIAGKGALWGLPERSMAFAVAVLVTATNAGSFVGEMLLSGAPPLPSIPGLEGSALPSYAQIVLFTVPPVTAAVFLGVKLFRFPRASWLALMALPLFWATRMLVDLTAGVSEVPPAGILVWPIAYTSFLAAAALAGVWLATRESVGAGMSPNGGAGGVNP